MKNAEWKLLLWKAGLARDLGDLAKKKSLLWISHIHGHLWAKQSMKTSGGS
jgi:hypothetical protein